MMRRNWRRWPLSVVLCLGLSSLATAQNAGTFVFTSDPNPDMPKDAKSVIQVRPNTPESRYLFVKNPTGNKAAYTVELREAKGRVLLATGKIQLAANQQARVKLEKAPPPPSPKLAATAPPNAAPAPAAPLPGAELKRDSEGQFRFLLRLLDDEGKPVLDAQNKPIESRVGIELLQPVSYIEEPTITITSDGRRLDVSVKSTKEFSGPPAVIELVFPPQKSLRTETFGAGVYRRLIKGPEQKVTLQASELPIVDGAKELVKFWINVDGFARAFIYEPDFRRPTDKALLQLVRTPSVLVLPLNADRPKEKFVAKPGDTFPVRMEVDNAPPGAKLSLRFDRSGTGLFNEADETTPLESIREERVVLEPRGDDESVVVHFDVKDWVQQLDTRDLRGKHAVQAVIDFSLDGKPDQSRNSFNLILDDSPPEKDKIAFGEFPEKHIKGTLLKVSASAEGAKDSKALVTNAVFFLGKPAADGKLPEVKAQGEEGTSGVWSAKLPVPDKKGFIEVGVQFTKENGLSTVKTQKIELIDPPAPGGTIEGVVVLGRLGQPKVSVTLRDADGKEKGSVLTDEDEDGDGKDKKAKKKGAFKFTGLAPGVYRLSAAKPDSGVGTKGSTEAQVTAGNITKVSIELGRKP